MSHKDTITEQSEKSQLVINGLRHPVTIENSPEETIKRMRSFSERAAKFRETIRALREANSR